MTGFKPLAMAQLKAFFRDRMLQFWIIAFPLMFLVLFGGILGGSSEQGRLKVAQVGPVALFDQLPPEARQGVDEVLEIEKAASEQAALEQVRKGDVAGLVTMQGNEVHLTFSRADQVRAGIVQGTLSSIVDGANVAATGRPPTFTLTTEQVEDTSLKAIQYVTPGLLAWAVSMSAVFGAGLTLVQWRKNGLLRRLRLSPVGTPALVLSRSLITLFMAVVQFVIFVGVGMAFFGLRLTGSWWASIPLMLVGALAFQAIGLVVGAISKTEESASGLANLVILPMAFLSGSFFPLDSAPGWMQTMSTVLPMGQLNRGMSDVMVRGEGPGAVVVPMLVLAGFALVFTLLAAKVFRWDDA